MVEFNKEPQGNDFPIIDENDPGEKPNIEKRLREDLNRLIVVWQEKEDFAHDTANHKYADGVASCIEDLQNVVSQNATT